MYDFVVGSKKKINENCIHVLNKTIFYLSRYAIGLVTVGLHREWGIWEICVAPFLYGYVGMVRSLLRIQTVERFVVEDLVRMIRQTKKKRIGSFSQVSKPLFSGVSYKTWFPECIKPGELESYSWRVDQNEFNSDSECQRCGCTTTKSRPWFNGGMTFSFKISSKGVGVIPCLSGPSLWFHFKLLVTILGLMTTFVSSLWKRFPKLER